MIQFGEDYFEIEINNNILIKELNKKFKMESSLIDIFSSEKLPIGVKDKKNMLINLNSWLFNKNNEVIHYMVYALLGTTIFENALLKNSYYISF